MIRVLLADDEPDLRMLLRFTLEEDGRFEVVADAENGEQAIEMLATAHPDVLVLDMAMPKMDGLQVLAMMRERGYDAKVLAFSGFNGGVEDEAMALGAAGYLRKGTGVLTEIVPRLLSVVSASP